ncbi:MAG: winged helix-turn-helix transcriptional regulator, partial [Bacteroidales bacterium]|nr:winged helix-turn-helix transcriptional regulator [Bacteroidales bacterium]
ISPIHYEGLQRIEPLEIPEDAFREAIFNSIIHKDYMGVAIQMKVWRDRIELWNYGRLPEELTIAKLHEPHASNARNKNIAFAFYKAGFIEAWGRGISKIVTQFTAAGLKEPKFEDFCGGVRVTIYRNTDLVAETIEKNNGKVVENEGEVTKRDVENTEIAQKIAQKNVQKIAQKSTQKSTQKNNGEAENNDVKDINNGIYENSGSAQKSTQKNTEKIISSIKQNSSITIGDLSKITGLSEKGVKKILSKLKFQNLIRRIGPDKGGYWVVINT